MAIKALISIVDTVDFIAPSDGAVCTASSDLEQYWDSFNFDHLDFIDVETDMDKPTVWTIGPLDAHAHGMIIDSVRGELSGDPGTDHTYKVAREHARWALRGVSNFCYPKPKDGKEHLKRFTHDDVEWTEGEFKTTTVGHGRNAVTLAHDDIINAIPDIVLMDLYQAIILVSHVTDAEKKP